MKARCDGTQEARFTRVLMVIGQLEIGGTERHIELMSGALNTPPLALSVFSFRAGGALVSALRARGVEVIEGARRGGPIGAVIGAARLLTHLWRKRPEIVHFFLPQAYLLGGYTCLLAPRSTRIMSRRSLNRYQRKYPGVRWLEKTLHGRMHALLANSNAVRAELLLEGVPDNRIHVIYNGVATDPRDADQARARVRRELDIGVDALIFVVVANLFHYKGHLDLLAALAAVGAELPDDWRALLIGAGGDAEGAVKKRIAELGLGRHVLLLGQKADVRGYLRAADVGVSCSHEEGFSNAVLESMAAGLAMVVTDAGGNREAVIDGECGLVVPAGAPIALAAALLKVGGAPELRRRLGAAARQRVEQHFSIEDCVERYRNLYLGLVASASAAGRGAAKVVDGHRS